ncbi:MAG: hypothetical protein JWM75_2127 [Sphingomonas bacterium]|nr:hypothetical protein [Sphingomonas bacterium]
MATDEVEPIDQPTRPARIFASDAAHLVRTTQLIHVQLSQMADQKASILMGATFVIFTIAIGQTKGGALPSLPLLILGAAAFFSAVLAVLAILPATHYHATPNPNLLFFGTFTHFDEEDYTERLLTLLEANERIYRTIIRDIHQNGVVLERKKYRLLGYAYRVFLIGLTASFAAALIEYGLYRG